MWLAVIIFVSLSVEVLSYLTGGEVHLTDGQRTEGLQ